MSSFGTFLDSKLRISWKQTDGFVNTEEQSRKGGFLLQRSSSLMLAEVKVRAWQ